jgi:AbiV family abortive infection protein
MSNVIPCESLEKGLQIINRNIKSLIETATLLNQNKKFVHSATFSIFAIEEMAKANLLSANHSQKKDIPYAEWDRIVKGRNRKSAHFEKWKTYLESLALKIHPELTKDETVELLAEYYVRLKNNVLYVFWDKRLNQWYWLPDDYSEAEQEKISAELLNAARKGYEKYQVT